MSGTVRTNVSDKETLALMTDRIHHRGPDFRELMLRTLGRLQEVCRTQNEVLLFTASGSGAFESAIVNLLSPGEPVLVPAGAASVRCHLGRTHAPDGSRNRQYLLPSVPGTTTRPCT